MKLTSCISRSVASIALTLAFAGYGWAQTVTQTTETSAPEAASDATAQTADSSATQEQNSDQSGAATEPSEADEMQAIAVVDETEQAQNEATAYETGEAYSADELSAELDLLLEDEDERVVKFSANGYYRVRGVFIDEPDMTDAQYPKNLAFVQHRLWVHPELSLQRGPDVKLAADILFGENLQPCQDPYLRGIRTHPCTGLWGANGDNVLSTNTADQIANLSLARIYGEATTPIGLVRIGRQGSHWGLGIFANDGQHDQLFGDNHRADTYDRIAFATKPLGAESDFIVALFGDKIVEGSPTLDIGGYGNNDDVFQTGAALLYSTDPLKFGGYQVFRKQSVTRSQIHVTDLYGYLDIGLLHGGFEMFWLYGKTQGVPSIKIDNNLNLSFPETKLNVFAWAAQLGLRGNLYEAIIRAGSVSGDGNSTSDGVISSYTLNSNYRAGLIMWDYAAANRAERVLQSQLNSLRILRDDGRATQAQIDEVNKVADLQRTRGGINNALFVNPVVQLRPTQATEVKLGLLWAQANNPAALDGTLNSASEPVGNNYGWEFDAGFMYSIAKVFEIGFEAAYFLPGDMFERPQTVEDPATGAEVAIAGATEKPSHARMIMLKATWNFDY